MRKGRAAVVFLLVCLSAGLAAQRPAQVVQFELRHAERDVPKLAEVLNIQPGMSVADIGAGGGAMSMFMARQVGATGRVYATEIGSAQLAELCELVAREHLANVVVLEGAARATNLPEACCDAIFMQDVYHHLVYPDEIDRSTLSALKPGGRLAVIDFEPKPGSKVPDGVAANRGGHGVLPAIVVQEIAGAGLTHVRTIDRWPTEPTPGEFFLALFRKPHAADD